jgi:pimeloyl-ACP methyl ester carboxylesterase
MSLSKVPLLAAMAFQSLVVAQPRAANADTASGAVEAAVSGQGQPIVLVGGGLQGRDSWGPVLPRLETMRRVVRPQNLNVAFGVEGQDLPSGYSVRMESAALRRALDKLALKGPVDVIGWSSGGAIALDFALGNPERIRSLTLIEPAAFWVLTPNDRSDRSLARMAELARNLKGEITEEQFEAFMCGNGSFNCAEASPRTSPLWSRLVRYKQALNGLGAYVDHADSVDRLRSFRKPVLIITGSQSPGFARNVNQSLARHISSSESVELPGGHASFLTSPDLFFEKLAGFLQRAGGALR